ncbi:hypothetical protein DQR70_06340 [Salmonella enterica subsp. enterica serovar Oslo]|nr:hypothetical protein [Salmonella enterica subsp. enterica serovar Oslo]
MVPNMEKKVTEAIERELERDPSMQLSIVGAIHDPNINDAQRVARIAQNMYALNQGFFELLYDHLIIEEMMAGPFIDMEGKKRQIVIVDDQEEDAKVVHDELRLSTKFWDSVDIRGTQLKNIIGRYLMGLHVHTDKKLANKHITAIDLRIKAEFSAFSDMLNAQFYEFTEEQLQALALTMSEIGIKFILPNWPQFCTEEEIAKMYPMAFKSIVDSMDDPSEKPLIRAFNTAVPNCLFLDERAADIRRIFTGSLALARENEAYRETLDLDYMSRCMELVRF